MVHPRHPLTHIFDTCVFIDHLKYSLPAAGTLILQAASGQLHASVSAITIAELWAGVRNRQDARDHELELAPFFPFVIDDAIAKRAGEIVHKYLRNGVSIADGIIAATAERHNLILYTRNVDHFQLIVQSANFVIQSY